MNFGSVEETRLDHAIRSSVVVTELSLGRDIESASALTDNIAPARICTPRYSLVPRL